MFNINFGLKALNGGGKLGQEQVVLPENAGIDLFKLWESLLEERKAIITVTLLVVVVGGLLAGLLPRVYQSSAYFLPPQSKQIQEINKLNLQFTQMTHFSIDSVFNRFKENLSSRYLFQKLFDKQKLARLYMRAASDLPISKNDSRYVKAFESFLKDIHVNKPKKSEYKSGISIVLSLPVSDLEVTDLLREHIANVMSYTVNQLYSEVNLEKQAYIERIQQQIDSARKVQLDIRLDRIAQLVEAIQIAKALKIAEPVSAGPQVKIQGVQNTGLPLYLLGYKLLEAEKKTLLARKSDDPFIGKLRGMQEQLSLLNSIAIDKSLISVVRVDQSPLLGLKVSPKVLLIMIMSILMGLILGVLIALVRQSFKNRKQVIDDK